MVQGVDSDAAASESPVEPLPVIRFRCVDRSWFLLQGFQIGGDLTQCIAVEPVQRQQSLANGLRARALIAFGRVQDGRELIAPDG